MEGTRSASRSDPVGSPALAPPALVPALPPEWVRYRNGYVLLQHLFSLAGGSPEEEVSVSRLAHDLCFSGTDEREVVRYLQLNGYLNCPGNRASLTWPAIRYLQAEHGRRRSIRPR